MKPAQTACAIVMLVFWLPAQAIVTCSETNAAVAATTPTTNFVDHGDGTVTDTTTGLMWMRCPLGKEWHGGTSCVRSANTYSWRWALWVAQAINSGVSNDDNDFAAGFAGHTDWRLPNKNELASIIEERCYSPALNLALFPNVQQPLRFWSSTPFARSANQAWWVDFAGGEIDTALKTPTGYKVRLVRGGQ